MTPLRTDGMWLFVRAAARAAGVSEKTLRRRIERETMTGEVRDGRRLVLVESVCDDPAPPRRGGELAPLMERLERLAGEVGRLRALTLVAESTE